MVDDDEAMNIIQKIAPSLHQMLKSGDIDNIINQVQVTNELTIS